ncbi:MULTISPECIES: CU044_5270 family protein [unclassified Nonomuraea]|uniref:CU044_5270 family protein n=1 Tax=unclassified Nonomuraea TaxID=2593643 RepID=UPI003406430C
MDDLNTLRELRSDAPAADAGHLAPARARLLAEARGEPGLRSRPGRRARSALRVRPVLVAAVACLVAAVAVVVVQRQGPSRPAEPPRYESPSAVLEQAALVASARSIRSTGSPRPDQWQYRRTMATGHGEGPGKGRIMESWTRYDGTQTAGFDPGGKLRVENTRPDPGDDDLTPQQYHRKLRALPTDPAELLARVRADEHWQRLPTEEAGQEDPDARAFRVLSIYLQQQAFMPPKLEAAMYRALALIPGVGVQADVQDGAGRKGLGVFRDDPHWAARQYLILQPGTYRYLGDRTLWLRDEVAGGDLLRSAGQSDARAELVSGIVDRPGQRL